MSKKEPIAKPKQEPVIHWWNKNLLEPMDDFEVEALDRIRESRDHVVWYSQF